MRLRALGLVIVFACTTESSDESDTGTPRHLSSVAEGDTVLLIGAGDIGSCGLTSKDEATAALIQQHPTALVFTLGDNAYPNGTATNYLCYEASWGAFKARTRPVPGNHEYNAPTPETSVAEGYFDYFNGPGIDSGVAGKRGAGYYAYDHGAWRIYALNSERNLAEQSAWMAADLAAHPRTCRLVAFHKPLFTSGTNHPPDVLMRPLWDTLYAYGVSVVLSAHNHQYERFAPQRPDGTADAARGARQFVVGGGGNESLYNFIATPSPNSVVRFKGHGVLLLGLHASGYTWRHLALAGQTFTDNGSSPCSGAPPEPPPSIVLAVTGRSDATKQYMTLTWTGASATLLDVYRNGSRITTTENDGRYTNSRTYQGTATYTYKVCAVGTSNCSNSATISFGGGSPPPNAPPTAGFTSRCTGLSCTFTDGSTDSDGSVTAWQWSFGDGGTSTTRNPTRVYSSAGTYSVSLMVTDDAGATGVRTAPLTVIQSPSIVLSVSPRTSSTTHYVTLSWSGARGATVDVYRNGAFRTNTPNDGHYTNTRTFTGAATYTYKVCEPGTLLCSNEATAVFK